MLGARHLLLTLVVAVGLVSSAAAQSAQVTMSASGNRVAVGEPFELEIHATIDGGQPDDVRVPDFGTLEVLGRRVSRPFSFSFGFGTGGQHAVMKSELVYSFTLRAVKAGTYRIDPAVVVVGRRKYSSGPLTVEASGTSVPSSGLSQQQLQQQNNLDDEPFDQPPARLDAPPEGPLDGAKYDPDMFLRTVVDKKKAYVGEQVTATIYLYVRGGMHQNPSLTREPTTEGFWVQDLLPPQRSLSPIRQDVKGRPYSVVVLRRFAAFALRPGNMHIGAPAVEVSGGPSLFDLINGPSEPTRRSGVQVDIEALPLPPRTNTQRPVHVGSLDLAATLEPKSARVGDAVTLTVTAHGMGNLRELELPTPQVASAEVLPPEIHDEQTMDRDQIGGDRTYKWLVLPRAPGALTVPSFEVDVFDPQGDGTMKTVSTLPLTFAVTGAAAAPANAAAETPEDAESKPHFGPVRTHSEFARRKLSLAERPWYGWALAFGPLAFAAVLLGRVLRRNAATRRQSTSGSRKFRDAQAKLDEAQSAAARGDGHAALSALAASLKQSLEARLGEPVGGLTRSALRGHLTSRGMGTPLAERLVTQLETAELSRFDPTPKSKGELESEIAKARGVLRELERFSPRQEAAS